MSRADPEALRRAARLSRLPGVRLAEAAARCRVSVSALRRARAALGAEAAPSRGDLLIAAITRNGESTEAPLPPLDGLASWLDYVNHDGSTAADVAALLVELEREGLLRVEAGRARLLRPWP